MIKSRGRATVDLSLLFIFFSPLFLLIPQIFILLCIGFMEFIIFMIIFYLNIDTAFWII